eukprot:gene21279-27302_t
MFLGEHTHKSAQTIMDRSIADYHLDAQYRLDHFYPVMPFKHIVGHKAAKELGKTRPFSSQDTLFSIQGHFGGSKHGRRKDPIGVMDCLRAIEQKQHLMGLNATHDDRRWLKSLSHQGNESSPGRALLRSSPSASTLSPQRLNIDLIGRKNGEVETGTLQHGRIRFLSDLASQDYYMAIARSRFMIAAIRDASYWTSAATSSVPAALMTEIPVVATRSFLQLYPCLRDGPLHVRINSNENECDSIAIAASLSESDYRAAKEEVRRCGEQMWTSAKETFSRILRKDDR